MRRERHCCGEHLGELTTHPGREHE
jgi:hypothetical protein